MYIVDRAREFLYNMIICNTSARSYALPYLTTPGVTTMNLEKCRVLRVQSTGLPTMRSGGI